MNRLLLAALVLACSLAGAHPAPGESGRSVFSAEQREWWAIQPVRKVQPPQVSSAGPIRNDIDPFILDRLEREQLQPSPEAHPDVLIRRVTFDLTGLPPTPSEIDAFLADSSPGAYERLVDRLLDSPRYGERMARHWLDLARYADSDGYRADEYRPDAWRYRDYVIRSFNEDKPYDRFVQEQLAGDELFPAEPDAIIATGYLRHGIYEYNARDVRGQWNIILNDLTDTTGDVFLGLGMQCARCHDHKFDPILQKDYYRLQAYFAPIQPGDRIAATAREVAAHREKMKDWETETAEIRAAIEALEKPYRDKAEAIAVGRFPDDIQAMIRKPEAEREPFEHQLATMAWRQVVWDWERLDNTIKGEDKERLLALRRDLAALSAEKPAPLPVAFAAADVGPLAPPMFIPKNESRGPVEPGVLSILDANPAQINPLPHSTGRRSALARWLTNPENPLTARVMANRVWQQHFGRGLAANPSDFGTLGEKPSHPELLDWLAATFVEEGWSLKRLHRLIVTSAAYRRSSEHPSPARELSVDPENRLLWRWRPRRLDAEQIRDSILAVSGALQPVSGGPGVPPDEPRRTIFTRFMRNTRDPFADAFDAPLWFFSSASRDTTTTPVQSLFLANSPALRAYGRAFAERLERSGSPDPVARIRTAYRLAYGREASSEEVAAAVGFLQEQSALAERSRLESAQAAFIPGTVPYRDGQAAFFEPVGSQSILLAEQTDSLQLDGPFTIEAFIVPRSVSESGSLRTIAARWDGDNSGAGWVLGITGQQSRRKPLTVALQLIGTNSTGVRLEHPVFSELSVRLNTPYFVAAAVTPAGPAGAGQVFFALKDLSNDDEPLLTAHVEHPMAGGWSNSLPLSIGGRSGGNPNSFHGMIDDVRISSGALQLPALLYSTQAESEGTLGYWRFESRPDVLADSSGHGRNLLPPGTETTALSPGRAALSDFCHALFNSSEFLYIE